MQPDLILAGGGLANALIAHRLHQTHPGLRLLLLESGPSLGGNHTWSFHASDVSAAARAWLEPFIVHRWPGHEVRFPQHTRRINGEYCSVTSERLHRLVADELGEAVRLDCAITDLTARSVTLASGETIFAGAVVDGRGQVPSPALDLGYQKFLGIEVELAAPHGLTHPIIMDATVAQIDGYRFLYTLPLAPDRLLIEDTRYSDGPALADDELRQEALDYARLQGWQVARILREERGVLPIALGGDIGAFWREPVRRIPCCGLRAGLFHATTGYSLLESVRLAEALATLPDFAPQTLLAAIRAQADSHWRRQGFYRLLNRMLFRAALPGQRYRVLQRFYRLPLPLILRFYAGRSSGWDKLRILSGKPPVPLGRALRCLRDPIHRKA